MRITTYRTEMDKDKRPILIKENACNYTAENSMNQPEKIVKMVNEVFHLNLRTEEYVYLICLDSKTRVLGIMEVSHGTLSMSLCNPREVFLKALCLNTDGIVLVHNHPSGDVTPSREDFQAKTKISELGKILAIPLRDFIIVGENGTYYSAYKNNHM